MTLSLLLLTLAAAADTTATLDVTPAAVRLSESATATLTVTGPAPLVVVPPAGPTGSAWRSRPAGPPERETLPDGRERWRQTYRLDPFAAGPAVVVSFPPVTATTAGTQTVLEIPVTSVAVRTTITDPKPSDARPITGIEDVPDDPAPPLPAWPWVLAGVAVCAAAAWFRRRRRPPITLEAWAAAALAKLESASAEAFPEELSAVLRSWAERRYNVPAPRLTTEELAATPAAALVPILARCDLAKFAARGVTAAERHELLASARASLGEPGASLGEPGA